MANKKEVRTNAMRILDKAGVDYTVNTYECDEFIDALHISDMLGQPYDNVLKTLVLVGKSGEHYVFVIPIHRELDMKKRCKCFPPGCCKKPPAISEAAVPPSA